MKVTREAIISDIGSCASLVGHYASPIMATHNVYRFSLAEVVGHWLNRESDEDILLFAEMALWCFDNCYNKWYFSWNLDSAYFLEETDMMAFKLRWI